MPGKGRTTRKSAAKGGKRSTKRASRSSQPVKESPDAEFSAFDVFDADNDARRDDLASDKYKDVDVYEYQMPGEGEFEDEEIDSDEAFNSEDEEKYGEHFRRKAEYATKKKRGKKAKAAAASANLLDESDDDGAADKSDEEDEDEGDMMDLSELLGSAKATAVGGDQEDDDDDAAELSPDDEALDEQEDEYRHSNLVSAISSLGKRKVRRKERGEALEESTANLRSSSDTLSLQDLLSTAGNRADLGDLKKQVDSLTKSKATLSKPLDRGAKEQMERSVAYKKVSEEIGKWVPSVKAHREAEHLEFPMAGATSHPLTQTCASLAQRFEPTTALEKQVTQVLDTSKAVQEDTKRLTATEIEGLKKLDRDEAKERRKQLAKLRALETYYEAKCRRLKKIKSKRYRRILRKADEKRKEKLSIEELAALDEDEAVERLDKAERTRAMERMSLRHKNQGKWAKRMLSRQHVDNETKKALGDQLNLDRELRQKVTMQRRDSDDSDEDEDDSDSDRNADNSGSDNDMDDDQVADALQDLRKQISSNMDELPEHLQKAVAAPTGIAAMGFMKKAAERKRQEAKEELERLEAELRNEQPGSKTSSGGRMSFGPATDNWQVDDDDLDQNDGHDDEEKPSTSTIMRTSAAVSIKTRSAAARALLGNAKNAARKADDETQEIVAEEEEESSDEEETFSSKRRALASAKPLGSRHAEQDDASDRGEEEEVEEEENHDDGGDGDEDEERGQEEEDFGTSPKANHDAANPWLAAATQGTSTADAGVVQTKMDKTTTKQEKRVAKLQRGQRSQGGKMAQSSPVIDVEAVEAEHAKASGGASKPRANGNATIGSIETDGKTSIHDQLDDVEDTEDGATFIMTGSGGNEQLELIKQAFAGDDVVAADFEAEKQQVLEESRPKDKDLTLPGWGTWGGEGVANPFPSRRIIEKAPPQAPRKDGNLKTVIINEKRDKKLASRMVQELPHPYKHHAQFERTVAAPVGREWNTHGKFKGMIQPAVHVQAGAIVEPMKLTKSVVKEGKRKAQEREKLRKRHKKNK